MMCLAIPMKIVEITGFNALCEARGAERNVSLFLIQFEELKAGDMVMVHLSKAVSKVTEAEAKLAWDLYDEMLAIEDGIDSQ